MKKGQINIAYKGRKIGFNGKEQLVGRADRYSTIEYAALIEYAAKAAAVPESSIEMAMESIFDAMNYFVLNGHSVQIPNLGTFSIAVSAKTTATEQEFTNNFANNLRGVKVNFLPDPEMKAMIANTAIKTSVDMEGYNDNGTIAIKSAFFAAGNTLVPLIEGRTYAIGSINRISLAGSRLSSTYLGGTPVRLVWIDDQGAEHSSLVAGTTLSMSYSALSVNLKNFLVSQPTAKFLKGITVSDKDGNVVKSWVFGGATALPYISGVNVNNMPIAPGATIPYVEGSVAKVKVYGANLAAADIVTIAGEEVEVSAGSSDYMLINYQPAHTGNAPLVVGITGGDSCTYNMSFGEEGGIVITSVTAGGDALVNGGNTTIQDGNNYQIAIAGSGLADLTADNFLLPAGSSINITSQGDTMIQATLQSAHAGDFKVMDGDRVIFAAALVVAAPSVTLSGYSETENGQAIGFGTALVVVSGQAKDVYIKGNEVDELTQADFVGKNVTVNSWNAGTGLLNVTLNASSGQVYIKNDGTTIATLTLQTEGGGNNHNPIDTGN